MAAAGLRLQSGARISAVRTALQRLPLTVGARVASAAAPALTGAAGASFDAGRTAYDTPRPLGVDGNALALRATGATREMVRFVANGTILRCVLGTRYARYLIGKYAILPASKAAIPAGWRALIAATADREIRGALP